MFVEICKKLEKFLNFLFLFSSVNIPFSFPGRFPLFYSIGLIASSKALGPETSYILKQV